MTVSEYDHDVPFFYLFIITLSVSAVSVMLWWCVMMVERREKEGRIVAGSVVVDVVVSWLL